jgi:hypothetical protein
MNLGVDNGAHGKHRKTMGLAQTPTEVTYRILSHTTTQARYAAYCEWLRNLWPEPDWVKQPWNTAVFEGKPEWVEEQIKELGDFLRENPNARFYDR